MNLTEFLLARITEDEDAARDGWSYGTPARVLAECEAKREVVNKARETFDQRDRYSDGRPGFGRIYEGRGALAEHFLALLALPYANHPDYDPAWRP